ncbi:MAG: adenylate/guanylate cyclase domain-containing protein [Candidatus Sericytochromatia bacterium]|nr:adenylate/guanylate cyclase domain-containing protein [Candidatus Tanganyikabacteria bacterium]
MSDQVLGIEASRANLERMLQEMLDHPDRKEALTAEIERVFGRRKAVMVLDMSGFSRTTQQHGIVSFLLMIHQMHVLTRPCIAEHGGLTVKEEADNLFCLFDTPQAALDAARAIHRTLTTANHLLPEERKLYASIGIGFGDILYIGEEDLFGNEVNLASKLGEDIAERGETLLTQAARAALPGAVAGLEELQLAISGLSLTYYRVG